MRRSVSEEDRRQVRLSLTPKGRALVERSPPAAQERMMESVRTMPAPDRAHLMALLDRLMAGMAPDDGRAHTHAVSAVDGCSGGGCVNVQTKAGWTLGHDHDHAHTH